MGDRRYWTRYRNLFMLLYKTDRTHQKRVIHSAYVVTRFIHHVCSHSSIHCRLARYAGASSLFRVASTFLPRPVVAKLSYRVQGYLPVPWPYGIYLGRNGAAYHVDSFRSNSR